jgi:hypothetical protein
MAATWTLTVGTGAAATDAPTSDEIADRLISSVEGFEPAPEGGPVEDGNSGPVDVTELAALTGMTASGLPEDMEGYLRLFATPDGSSYAMALGVGTGDLDPGRFVEGFEGAAAAAGRPIELPSSNPWLGAVDAYEVRRSDGVVLQTAILAVPDGAVILMLSGGQSTEATLAEMISEQAALTPPTPMDAPSDAAGMEPGEATDDGSTARRAGRTLGRLAAVGAVITLVAYLITRGRRQPPPGPH